MSGGDTLPRLLWRNAARWPDRPAWRHKRLGIWQTISWSAFAARVGDIALGLEDCGFGRGSRLAVLGDNRPELYAALLAAQAVAGVGVPLDPDTETATLAAILRDAGVSVAIADTIDQAERLRAATEGGTLRVLCADAGGVQGDAAWQHASLDALAAEGLLRRQRDPDGLAILLARGIPQDLALLLYPADASGSAAPRPTALSHLRLLTAADSVAAGHALHPTDNTLCYLPMPSYDDALYSLTLGLLGGFTCNCPETPDSAPRDLREIGPTVQFLSAEACAALAQLVSTKGDATTGFKRRIFHYFRKLALSAGQLREQGQAVPLGLLIGCLLGEWAVYAPLRDQLGLRRAHWVHVGASAPQEAIRLLRAFGLPLHAPALDAGADDAACAASETIHA